MIRGIACLLVGLLCAPAAGQEAKGPEFAGLRVGLGDCYKVGLWTQVELTIRGGSQPVRGVVTITVPDGDAVLQRVPVAGGQPIEIRPGRDTPVRGFVRFGRIESRLVAELTQDGQTIARRTFDTASTAGPDRYLSALGTSRPILLSVGPEPLGVEEAVAGQEQGPDSEPVVVRLDGVGQLPAEWYGYEGVDTVVLTASWPRLYRTMTPAQGDALDRWVRMGGKLLVAGGSEADRALAPKAPLARFAPGKFQKIVSIQQTGALETYCGSSAPVPLDTADRGEIRAARLGEVDGVVEAREADLPLVVRTARGFGQIVFLAVDLDEPPLSRWTGRGPLVRRLLDLRAPVGEDVGQSGPVMHYGFQDMAGQLRKALSRFEGVTLAPFWLVVLLAAVYVILIGPVDYFVLRRYVGRMTLTWVSFPIVVVAASVGAWFLAGGLKGREIRVSRAEVIDVDLSADQARGAAWMDVFSPAAERYDLSTRVTLPDGQPAADARGLLSWLGLPGAGLGGMARGSPSPLAVESYDVGADLSRMSDVPIQAWSTKSFTARWYGPCKASVEARLTAEDQVLSGTIANGLPMRLLRSVLVFGSWAYELGDLEPGGVATLGSSSRRSQLRTYLTGSRIVKEAGGDKYRQEMRPYDPADVDLPRILSMMMFFEEGGGARYTGLVNRYQAFVDLSPILHAGRAVLVGMAPEDGPVRPGTELLRDGRPMAQPQDTRVVFLRFVIPVGS